MAMVAMFLVVLGLLGLVYLTERHWFNRLRDHWRCDFMREHGWREEEIRKYMKDFQGFYDRQA